MQRLGGIREYVDRGRREQVECFNPRIAGYDGANGQRLWITPVLGALGESHHARIGLIGGTLIVADSGGTARAFRPGEDAAVWSVALGERADGLCSAGPGKVVVRTADDRAQVLDLTTGAAQPAAPPQSCTLDEYAQAAFRPDRTHDMKEIDFAVVRARSQEEKRIWELAPDLAEGEVLEVSPELQVLLGDRREGTCVPMVASLHGGRLAWSTVVPAEDPLRARSLTMPRATADTHAVFVGYERGDENRIAAFAMVDGRRLWDVEIPQMREDSNNIDAIGLTPDLLYVAHFTYLSALDRETGKERYTIGQRR